MDPVFAGDAGIVLGGRDEIAFLQNPYGADVVLGHEGMEWPLFDFGDEGGQGSRRNAPAPELAPDPVADQPLVLGDPASDVPNHLPVADDRADDVRGLPAELGPVCHEGVMIPRGKRRHPHGFRVALMLKEDRKLGVDDLAQNHPRWIAHAKSETPKRQNVKDAEQLERAAAIAGGQPDSWQHRRPKISVKNYMSAKHHHILNVIGTLTMSGAEGFCGSK